MIRGLPGCQDFRMYGAGIQRPKDMLPTVSTVAKDFLCSAVQSSQPWVCCASVVEPHDPYLTSRDAFSHYKVDDIPEPPNWNDRLEGRPGLYRKAGRTFARMTTSPETRGRGLLLRYDHRDRPGLWRVTAPGRGVQSGEQHDRSSHNGSRCLLGRARTVHEEHHGLRGGVQYSADSLWSRYSPRCFEQRTRGID